MSTIFCGWFSILSSLLKNEHALTHVKNWTEYSDQIIYFLITFWIIQLRPRIFIVFNLFSETNSGFILIFTWSVFQISVKTLFCYIAKPEYWIYVMKISRIRKIELMLWQSHGSHSRWIFSDNPTMPFIIRDVSNLNLLKCIFSLKVIQIHPFVSEIL